MWDVGVKYNVWTYDMTCQYNRHLFFDQLRKPVRIGFEIPYLSKRATIPLNASIFDDDGVYFSTTQTLAFDTPVEGKWKITPWRRVDAICNCVLELCEGGGA